MADPKSRFGALKTFRDEAGHVADETAAGSPNALVEPPAGKGRGRPAGKRSNPEFEATTVLLRKRTKRAASRLLQDTEANKDLSDLIESLLSDWISRHS